MSQYLIDLFGVGIVVLYNTNRDVVNPHLSGLTQFEERHGNPGTWLAHTMMAALIAANGAVLGWLVHGDAWWGALHFAAGGFAFYVHREIRNARSHWRKYKDPTHRKHERNKDLWSIRSGWALDGIMDALGPGLVLALTIWGWL